MSSDIELNLSKKTHEQAIKKLTNEFEKNLNENGTRYNEFELKYQNTSQYDPKGTMTFSNKSGLYYMYVHERENELKVVDYDCREKYLFHWIAFNKTLKENKGLFEDVMKTGMEYHNLKPQEIEKPSKSNIKKIKR